MASGKSPTLVPYTPQSLPLLPSGAGPWTQREFQALKASLDALNLMCPQPATKMPSVLADGMIRYARSPFWPVSGQAADAWVWYDQANSVWKFL
jgi:hypothetical protein